MLKCKFNQLERKHRDEVDDEPARKILFDDEALLVHPVGALGARLLKGEVERRVSSFPSMLYCNLKLLWLSLGTQQQRQSSRDRETERQSYRKTDRE